MAIAWVDLEFHSQISPLEYLARLFLLLSRPHRHRHRGSIASLGVVGRIHDGFESRHQRMPLGRQKTVVSLLMNAVSFRNSLS